MVMSLRRLPTTPRLELVDALVQRFAPETRAPAPAPARGVERDAGLGRAVQAIPARIQLAEVPDRVALVVRVLVIDQIRRLFSVVEKPDDSVQEVGRALVIHAEVPVRIWVAAGRSGLDASPVINRPPNVAGVRVIIQQIAELVWDNLSIHSVLPHVLARGPVVGATGYPRFYHRIA